LAAIRCRAETIACSRRKRIEPSNPLGGPMKKAPAPNAGFEYYFIK
jgi:hypothetical protein